MVGGGGQGWWGGGGSMARQVESPSPINVWCCSVGVVQPRHEAGREGGQWSKTEAIRRLKSGALMDALRAWQRWTPVVFC